MCEQCVSALFQVQSLLQVSLQKALDLLKAFLLLAQSHQEDAHG